VLLPSGRDHVKNAEDLSAVPDHLPVTGLPPMERTGSINDEGGPGGHVPILVEDAVGLNYRAVDVTQQWKREFPSLRKCRVARGGSPLIASKSIGISPGPTPGGRRWVGPARC